MPEFCTIGVYGFDEAGFFAALQEAGVDAFCDTRRRRGVRGSSYAFANAGRLQARLAELDIAYVHRLDLAPSRELRAAEARRDRAAQVTKRGRIELSAEFCAGYRAECLEDFDSAEFAASFGPDVRRVVLFCVEREPGACHRSIIAERLEMDLAITVCHLLPPMGDAVG